MTTGYNQNTDISVQAKYYFGSLDVLRVPDLLFQYVGLTDSNRANLLIASSGFTYLDQSIKRVVKHQRVLPFLGTMNITSGRQVCYSSRIG